MIAIIYLFMTWNYASCNTNSNYWQLFFYATLFIRLGLDELENNSKISKKLYYALIMLTSFVVLFGLSTYQIVRVSSNPSSFDDPEHKSACYQNRILFIGQCIFGYLICVKDALMLLHEKGGNTDTN